MISWPPISGEPLLVSSSQAESPMNLLFSCISKRGYILHVQASPCARARSVANAGRGLCVPVESKAISRHL